MVILYEDHSEITDILVEYISSSINANMQTIYIKGDTDTKGIIDALGYRFDYDSIIKLGKFSILDASESYAKDGKFNPKKMIALLKDIVTNAKKSGFSGVAVTGELSWVLNYDNGFEDIMEYENLLNDEVFSSFDISAICRYNLNEFSDEMLVNIIQVHPYIIWKQKVHDNPFYIPPEGFKDNNLHKYRVKTWLENIGKFTNLKSQYNSEVIKRVKETQDIRFELTDELIISISYLLEKHDTYTKNHSEQVALLTKSIAIKMRLSSETITNAYYAGLVHDIGKILINQDILNKKGRLTDDEFDVIKMHPSWGYETLSKSKTLKDVAKIVLHHHERWDGQGYPHNIKKDDIPLVSRILCIADSYDAMINKRSYRDALSIDEAIEEIKRCSGTQFDPNIVEVFLEAQAEKIIPFSQY